MTHGPRILGLDPSLRHFGYALVELLPEGERVLEMGTWHTKPTDRKRRLRQSSDDRRCAREVARRLWDKVVVRDVSLICCEVANVGKGIRAAKLMDRAQGLIDMVAEARQLPVLEVTAAELKRAVTGSGSASKAAVQDALQRRRWLSKDLDSMLRSEPDEHAWDALGAVVACLETSEVQTLRQMARALLVGRELREVE